MWVSRYNELKILSELGFNSDLKGLDDYEAQIYLFISECYNKEMGAEMKKPSKGKK